MARLARRKATPYDRRKADGGKPVGPGQGCPPHQAAQQMQRRGKRRTLQPRAASRDLDDVYGELWLQEHVALGPNPAKEAEGLAIAPDQHVLAVVDPLA